MPNDVDAWVNEVVPALKPPPAAAPTVPDTGSAPAEPPAAAPTASAEPAGGVADQGGEGASADGAGGDASGVAASGAPAAPAAPALSDADLPRWAQSRIDTMTRKMREAQEELQAARQRLAQFEPQAPVGPQGDGTKTGVPGLYTEDEVVRRAQQIAQQQQFDAACNSIYSKGKESFQDWDRRMETIRLAGGISADVIEAAMEAGEPHVILAGLAADPNELTRLQGLPPTRIGAAVAKFGQKLMSVPTAPKVSAAPLPPEGRARGTVTPERDVEKMTMAEFVAYMDAQDAKKAGRR